MSSKELNLNSEPLELSWELGRGSVLYADENFTVYISVKNISDKPLAIWDLGIMGCSDFYIKRYFLKMGSISGSPEKGIGKKLIKIICSIKNFWPNVHKECNIRKPPDIENHLSKEKKMIRARQDILKEHYYNQLQKGIKYLPWQLSPGETWSVNFDVETKNFLFFRPDKFKLNLFADYSNREYKYLFCYDKITGTDKKN
jgi:hypothetical protein